MCVLCDKTFPISAGTLNLIRPSVCLSVRPSVCHKNFNLGHNFCTITDGALILGMCVLCDKTFPMVPCHDLDHDLWPTSRSNFWQFQAIRNTCMLLLQNESEILPFPNKENDFILPEEDYQELTNKSYPRVGEMPRAEEKKAETHSMSLILFSKWFTIIPSLRNFYFSWKNISELSNVQFCFVFS